MAGTGTASCSVTGVPDAPVRDVEIVLKGALVHGGPGGEVGRRGSTPKVANPIARDEVRVRKQQSSGHHRQPPR